MSAIWGAIDLSGKPIKKEIPQLMLNAFSKCVIDRYEELCIENVYMGCGVQYFTPEAVFEQLPINTSHFCFTADAVLDNRNDLIKRLNISASEATNIPDGKLLFSMYQRYGNSCLNDLLGAYSFVWYDKNNNCIELISDAVGNRCLYYRLLDNVLYFSSLIEPLAQLSMNTTLNNRWLSDFLAMDHLFMINETEETPIQEIYRIAPAQHITITPQQMSKKIYWNPFANYTEYHFSSDQEYCEHFCSLWENAVTDVLRSNGETAIQLSGGLDSTAIAAIAAPYLKQKQKTLYSFTSVPMKGYQYNKEGYYIEDETEDVQKTASFYGNIDTEFIDLNSKSPWDIANKEFRILEIPFKSVQNCLWLFDSMEKAYAKKARIILSGSYGNTTISYTDLNVYMNTLYHRKQYQKLKREINLFAKNMGFSAKYALKEIQQLGNTDFEPTPYPFQHSFVKRDTAKQVGSDIHLFNMAQHQYDSSKDFSLYRENMLNFLALRQIGEITTKHSLATGVLLRDPTKDKRIIDFCIHLPVDQFCKEGIDRRLVKVYLKDKMPPHVIRFGKQGKQSADLQYRFKLNWETTRKEWLSLYEKYSNSHYVDTIYAKRQLLEQVNCEAYSAFDLTRHMYTLFVLQYEAYMNQHYPTANPINFVNDAIRPAQRPLLSVIIPVYNVEHQLTRCVESVVKQSYDNLEIILVNDGSTDNSGTLCDSLASTDSRIRVIHKQNEGVSSARNTGLNNAKGELIAFVDSDDWIEHTMYEDLYNLMLEQDADIAICNYKRILNGNISDPSNNQIRVFYQNELLDTYITGHDNCFFSHAVWNRLYKRKYVAYMSFPLCHKYEDRIMNARLLPHIPKGVYTGHAYYNYFMNENSLSSITMCKDDLSIFIYAFHEQEKNFDCHLCQDTIHKKLFDYYCTLLSMYCKYRKTSCEKECYRMLTHELHLIRKSARNSILSKKDIGTKDQLQLLASTYLLSSYPFINHVRDCLNL